MHSLVLICRLVLHFVFLALGGTTFAIFSRFKMNCLQQFTDYVYRYPDCQSCEDTLNILAVHVQFIKKDLLEFDLIGMKPFVANAIRQTILNDIPTMAIEDVYFHKNTSIFNCDYISQRLALIPIKTDPDCFKFVYNNELSKLNSDNTIVFNLDVKNTESQTIKVYSEKLICQPVGENQKKLPTIRPLFPRIPILCLKPNEEISCRIHSIKGCGRNHMKFCPGFASYCFHSKIDIIQTNFSPELALSVKNSFPSGVIELRSQPNGSVVPFVCNARLDRHTRSFKNDENVVNSLNVKYYRDHIIFTVESYGVIDPDTMIVKALDILVYKYNCWKEIIIKHKVNSVQKSST